jgi:hypothetical protein
MTDDPGVPAGGKGDSPPTGDVLKRAFDNAQRMVDRDAEILDQLRSRASTLLAALAIGGAILGAVLSSATHPRVPWWVVAPLVLAVVLCVLVLWSTRDYGRLTKPVPGQRRPRRRPAKRGTEALAAQEIRQVRTGARDFVNAATRFRDEADAAIAELDLLRAAAQAKGEAVTDRLSDVITQARARADQAIWQARTSAEDVFDRATGILAEAEAAVAEVERLRAGHATKARAAWAIGQTRVAAGALLVAATQTRAHVIAAPAVQEPEHAAGQPAEARADADKQAIGQARDTVRDLTAAAVRTREQADTAAVELEHPRWRRVRQRLGKRRGRLRRGWGHALGPWLEWYGALVEGDRRLWKVGLNRSDLAAAQRYAQRSHQLSGGPPSKLSAAAEAGLVDWYLLRRLYVAHSRNDGTINRRADLLRFAAGFAAAFVLALGTWLATMTPSTGKDGHSSGSATTSSPSPPAHPPTGPASPAPGGPPSSTVPSSTTVTPTTPAPGPAPVPTNPPVPTESGLG